MVLLKFIIDGKSEQNEWDMNQSMINRIDDFVFSVEKNKYFEQTNETGIQQIQVALSEYRRYSSLRKQTIERKRKKKSFFYLNFLK